MKLPLQVLLPLILFLIALLQLVTDPGRSDRPAYYIPGLAALLGGVLLLSVGTTIKSWQDERAKDRASETEKSQLREQLAVLKRETAFIGQVTTAQLKTARYLASLDEPIVSMQLALSLSETKRFSDLTPFLIVYELFDLSLPRHQVKEQGFYHIRYLAEPGGWKRGPINQQPTSFQIRRVLENPVDHGLSWLDNRLEIPALELPFFDETPKISTVWDLHNYGIRVYLTENLVFEVKAFHLVVNQIVVFEHSV